MSNLSLSLNTLARTLPASVRKKVYKTAKIVAAVAAVVLAVLPILPSLGIEWHYATVAATVASVLLSALGHLADANTQPVPALDSSPAPEPTP